MTTSFTGLWQPFYAEFNGEEAPKMMLDKMELELTDDRYYVRFGGVVSDEGSYIVTPEGLTLHGMRGTNAGRAIPSLCKFSSDILTICYGLDGIIPARFATATGEQRYLAKYQRRTSAA